MNNKDGCFKVLLFLFFIVGILFLLAFIGWVLWGLICVDIFNFPSLNYWQFMGLQILINILFNAHLTFTDKFMEEK